MRKRREIEKDVNNSMGSRRDEFLEFQMQKILVELLLDIRTSLNQLIENLRKNDR